jgi:hypothetical protein
LDRLLDILKSPLARRTIIGLYVLGLAISVAAYIGISTFHVEISGYVLGPETLEAGERNPVRGAILDTVEGDSFENARVEFEFAPASDAGSPTLLGTANSGDDGIFQSNLEIPAARTGTQTLTVRAQGPTLPKTFESTRAVQVAEPTDDPTSWPEPTNRVPKSEQADVPESPIIEQTGPIAIGVLPRDAELVRGLKNHFFLRTYDAETGEPVSAEISVKKVQGMGRWGKGQDLPESLRTDQMGLVELQLNPVGGMRLDLEARRADAPAETAAVSRATIHLHTVAAQLAVHTPDPLVSPGRPLRSDVFSVFRDGRLLVDLYQGGDWALATSTSLGATSTGDRGARLRMPYTDLPTSDGLYRLQVHRGLFGAGNSWDTTWIVAADSHTATAYHDAIKTTVGRIADHTDDPYFEALAKPGALPNVAEHATLATWLRATTRALPRHFGRPSQLFNTQKAQKARLSKWQRATKDELRTAIGAALVGGLAVLLYVVVVSLRERQRHRARMKEADLEMDLEADEGAEDEPLFVEESWQARVGAGALIVAALATFVMFGLGLMLILTLM